ncbi:hypothetical protein Tco_0472902 [Tanacetum coccineum]
MVKLIVTNLRFNAKKNQSTTSQVAHNHKIYTIGFIHYPIYTIAQDNQGRDLVLRRKKKKSLDYNNSFLGEYECSSLALDREERGDEKEEIGSLKTSSNNGDDKELVVIGEIGGVLLGGGDGGDFVSKVQE